MISRWLGCAAISILFSLSSCTIGPRPPCPNVFIAKNKSEIRITTYNVNWGDISWKDKDRKKTLEAIRLINPDMIFIDEATPSWKKYLNKGLIDLYPYALFTYCCDGSGYGVLSKYPVHPKKYIRSIIGWYPAYLVEADLPNTKLQFLMVHLMPSTTPDPLPLPKYPFLKRSYYREKEMQYFYSQIDFNHTPTVILGDFNEAEEGLASVFLKSKGLDDAQLYLPRYGFQYTWYWPLKFFTIAKRHDHIFYTPEFLQVVRSQVMYAGNSDHFPLTADFILRHR